MGRRISGCIKGLCSQLFRIHVELCNNYEYYYYLNYWKNVQIPEFGFLRNVLSTIVVLITGGVVMVMNPLKSNGLYHEISWLQYFSAVTHSFVCCL